MSPSQAAALAVLLALPSGGCAFARRDNRPLWNAFEAHLVPADRGWFWAAMPLLAPVGLVAIAGDLCVAHPIQVVDDAVTDAGALWRDGRIDFEHRYYSEMAALPLRVCATPIVGLGSFLGRSLFDWRSHAQVDADRAAAHEREQIKARARLVTWLQQVGAGGAPHIHAVPSLGSLGELDPELTDGVRTALAKATALGRMRLFELALHNPAIAAIVDPVAGLTDLDPGVRFRLIERWPEDRAVDAAVLDRLRNDAVESVREAAAERWPPPRQR